MKVAIYARVSKDQSSDDRRFQDIDNQLIPLREFCKSFDYEIVEEYVDRMSGANPARPQFRKMMNDAMMRRFSGIVVWKLDRFSREGVISTFSYLKKLRDRGIWLKSMTESWLDTNDQGISDIVFALMSWMSSEERRKISERTKAGIARRKAIGQWKGGRPRKNLTDDQKLEAIELHKSGRGALSIGRKLKVSKDTVVKHLIKRGVLK